MVPRDPRVLLVALDPREIVVQLVLPDLKERLDHKVFRDLMGPQEMRVLPVTPGPLVRRGLQLLGPLETLGCPELRGQLEHPGLGDLLEGLEQLDLLDKLELDLLVLRELLEIPVLQVPPEIQDLQGHPDPRVRLGLLDLWGQRVQSDLLVLEGVGVRGLRDLLEQLAQPEQLETLDQRVRMVYKDQLDQLEHLLVLRDFALNRMNARRIITVVVHNFVLIPMTVTTVHVIPAIPMLQLQQLAQHHIAYQQTRVFSVSAPTLPAMSGL